MKHTVEITKEAAQLLIGNDEHTWRGYSTVKESHETSEYQAHGVWIIVVHTFVSNITQYFIRDINA